MKIIAVLTALSLPLGAAAQPAPAGTGVEASTEAFLGISTITVTAPRVGGAEEAEVLKIARGTGVGAAVGGAGLMTYVLVFDLAGPFGWAASLIFLGGMTAYLSHRRLQGREDFPPSPAQGADAGRDRRPKASAK